MRQVFEIAYDIDKQYKMFLPGHETDYIQKLLSRMRKPYEHLMLADILTRIRPDGLFVDAGANIGNHTIFIAIAGFNVLSFEPNKELLPIIQKNIVLNELQKKIVLYPFALGAMPCKAKFVTLKPDNIGNQNLTLTGGDIDVRPYDTLNIDTKISVLKIDTEGMEYDVLIGAVKTITRDKPVIYFECVGIDNFRRIYDFMVENNYFYWDTFNGTPTHLFIHEGEINDKQQMAQRTEYLLSLLNKSEIPRHTYKQSPDLG